MTETKIYGTGGDILVSSVHYHVDSHSITLSGELADVSTTETVYAQMLAGKLSGELTFKMYWYVEGTLDTVFAPNTAVTFIANIGASGKSYTVPCLVKSYALENPNKGAVAVTITAASNGQWTAPV